MFYIIFLILVVVHRFDKCLMMHILVFAEKEDQEKQVVYLKFIIQLEETDQTLMAMSSALHNRSMRLIYLVQSFLVLKRLNHWQIRCNSV